MSSTINSPQDPDRTTPVGYHDQPSDRGGLDRGQVVAREKERFGGMKFGSAFFGWLAASGTAVLLGALLAAVGAAVGANSNATTADATNNAQTIGIVGAITLLVVTLVAYFCGGYVAGRMARFDGVKQGVGVWLWAVIAAIVVAVLSAIAGAKFNVLSSLNAFPSIPVSASALTTGGIITAILVAVIALVGAILGGLAGMRYHRKVDKAGLDN